MIDAVPEAFAVTKPVALTVAMVASLVDHVIVRPVTTPLDASNSVAVSCTVGVVARLNVADGGEICTVATAGITLIVDEPDFVSAVATIDAAPGLIPVTVVVGPLLGETEASVGWRLAQLTIRSVTTVPFTSLTVAVSCFVIPPVVTESDAGATTTLPTGAAMETIVTEFVLPSLVAVMCATPAATPVTRPVPSTVAADVLSDAQVTMRPVSVAPVESLVTAESCVV